MPVELFTDLERSILDIHVYVSPCIYRSGILCNNVCDIFYSQASLYSKAISSSLFSAGL